MEMKRKQKHISLRFSNKGFTIVELLVAMLLSLLAMAAIYSTFLSQHRSYQVQNETADMQQNIRSAMYSMEREIRMAGSNPFNSLSSSFGIIAAGQTSITFTEDVRGPVVGTTAVQMAPDGDAGDPDENITYALNGTNLVRTDNNIPIGNPNRAQVVAQNINVLDFVYLKDTGASTATLADIRSVQITIVAQTSHPLLYGMKNNNVYRNQQNTVIYVAPGDNVSRRTLTTLIHCRNLDL